MTAVIESLNGDSSSHDDSIAKREKDFASVTTELLSLYNLLDKAKNFGKPLGLLNSIESFNTLMTCIISEIEATELPRDKRDISVVLRISFC